MPQGHDCWGVSQRASTSCGGYWHHIEFQAMGWTMGEVPFKGALLSWDIMTKVCLILAAVWLWSQEFGSVTFQHLRGCFSMRSSAC